ncbi:MAG: glycosyltransferase [Negativicutes bacterium]|nr:glycosyltransferase [Negativicutes bacterium]
MSFFRFGVPYLYLKPLQQVECDGRGYRNTGKDVRFAVLARFGHLPKGWVLISFTGSAGTEVLHLNFRIEDGQGRLVDSVLVPGRNHESVELIARFPDQVGAIHLEILDVEGYFEIKSLKIREISKPSILIYAVKTIIKKRGLAKSTNFFCDAVNVMRSNGFSEFKNYILAVYMNSVGRYTRLSKWFKDYRLSAPALLLLAEREWPDTAPSFSVVIPVYNTPETWLREAIGSVVAQIYQRWELICVDDCSPAPHVGKVLAEFAGKDSRIIHVRNDKNLDVSATTNAALERASGDYVLFMDHDDYLEPQALWRMADAIIREDSDFLYADEVAVEESNLDGVVSVFAHPAFSYDYYIGKPYFVHPVVVRRQIVEKIGGVDVAINVSQDIDFNLRALEQARTVTHVPDILYRWRQYQKSTGHLRMSEVMKESCDARRRHLHRLGFSGKVAPGPVFNVFDVNFFPKTPERVAIVIPTKNQGKLLRKCIDSILMTVDHGACDIVVIDHESDDPKTCTYLAKLAEVHTVVRYKGKWNFSRINNSAIRQIEGRYDYYLFMNNDVVAIKPGWFDAMLDVAKRGDIGVVGATLLYPDRTIQHGGVIVGVLEGAEHAHKFLSSGSEAARAPGYNGSLIVARDYSAVTAACMLVRASVFHAVGGFDEALAVGFNDTDLCLRIRNFGYKVVNQGLAVLLHYESVSRGTGLASAHPQDTALFRSRYRKLLDDGDPYYSPLFSTSDTRFTLREGASCPLYVQPRTVTNFLPLPSPQTISGAARLEDEGAH